MIEARLTASYTRESVTRDRLVRAMAGGAELDALAHELEKSPTPASTGAPHDE